MISLKVQFNGAGQEYSYYNDTGKTVQKGDYVIVNSPYNGIVTAKVSSVATIKEFTKATKFIVDVVDLTNYKERELKRQLVIDIKGKLDRKLEAFNRQRSYDALVMNDAEAEELLYQLKNLTKE